MDIDTQGVESTVSAVAVAGESAGALSATVPLDAQMGNASGADWQEEVYQKIKSMKEMYLSELNDLYQKIASKVQQHDSLPQSPQNEQIEKLKMFKMTLERILLFLRLNKRDIQPVHKKKLLPVEKHISFFLSTNRPGKPTSSDALQQSPSKQREQRMLPQCNQLLLMQQELFQRQQLMQQQQAMNSLQQLTQHNSLSEVATGSLQQNPVNSTQVNTSSLSSQSGTNPVQTNLGTLQQMQQMLQNQQLRQQYHQQQVQELLLQRQLLMQQQQALQVLQQQMGMKTGVLVQWQPVGQLVGSHHSQLKSGISAPQLHQAPSPQWKEKVKVEGDVTQPMEFEPYTSTVEVFSVLMGNANEADWQEEVYQKIKSMREKHLLEINDLYQKIASAVQQHPQYEKIEKLKIFKMTLERIVLFLQLNKHEIQLSHKEKLFAVEKHISFFLSYKRPHKPTTSPLQGQLPQPSMHTSQAQNTYAHQTPTMDLDLQDIIFEFGRLLSFIV